MLYREIIALCSQIHTKHINTLCGQNVELLNVKLAVHMVTNGLQSGYLIPSHIQFVLRHHGMATLLVDAEAFINGKYLQIYRMQSP